MSECYKELREFSLTQGVDLFGVADITKIREKFHLSVETKEKFHRAISIGICLSRAVLEDVKNEPTRLYFSHYRSLNNLLDQTAIKIARFIEKKGFLALPIPASQIVNWVNQKAHLSHREIGLLAGLGWIGRNNLLVNEKFGSQFRLATILTNLDIACDLAQDRDCQNCYSCVDGCPAKAISEDKNNFNYQSCFNLLKEFQKKRIVDQYICGICVRECKGRIN